MAKDKDYDSNEFLATTKTKLRIGNIIRITETQTYRSCGRTSVIIAKGTYKIMGGCKKWNMFSRALVSDPPLYADAKLKYAKYTKAGKVYPTKDKCLEDFDKFMEDGICVIEDATTDLSTAGTVTSVSKHPSMAQWNGLFALFGLKGKVSFPGRSMQQIRVSNGKVSLNGVEIDAPRELIIHTTVDNRRKTFTDIIRALSGNDTTTQDVEDALTLALIK